MKTQSHRRSILFEPWYHPWVRVWLTLEGFFIGHPVVRSAIEPPRPEAVW